MGSPVRSVQKPEAGGDDEPFVTVPVRSVGTPVRVAARGWGSHRTIGSAVRAAVDGGVVVVAPGVYEESVAVDRDVTITTEPGGTVELVCPGGPALQVRAGRVSVLALTIRSPVAVSGGALLLQDCDLAAGSLALTGWAVADVTGCRIHDCTVPAVTVSGDARLQMTNCTIEDVDGDGVAVSQSSQARLAATTVARTTGTGLRVAGGAAASAVDCEIAEAGCGIQVEESAAFVAHATRLRDAGGDAVRVSGTSPRIQETPSTVDGTLDPRVVGGATLVDTTITRAGGTGILVTGAAQVRADRTQVRDTTRAGVSAGGNSAVDLVDCQVEGSASTGLVARESGRLSAAGTTIARAAANGVFAGDDATVTLAGCTVAESGFTAVHLAGQAGADLRDCTVTGTPEHGIRCTDRSILYLADSTVETVGMTGLQIEGGSDATVRTLAVTAATVGIRVQDTPHHPLIEACTVTRTGQA
ncbi:MAG TPA: right-handed parallel beta-helix repeat-containing protein, partial [Rugosimonospora sp.]|nr:right-handed parallel beta-helix repeat-containing protein [Rugosimonospora sp.]